MDITCPSVLHIIWLLLVAENFILQMIYFFNDSNPLYFTGKRISTPLLLFGGLFIVIFRTGTFPLIPGLILLAMGLGELGIEGSPVVEAADGEEPDSRGPAAGVTVILAGVLFLLVNVFIGGVLIRQNLGDLALVARSAALAVVVLGLVLVGLFRIARPGSETAPQILLYALGIAVLFTGALADRTGGPTPLGAAALVLTVSDTLVLIRMGLSLSKKTAAGFRILLAFLVVILLLYYLYMALLIDMAAPFFPGR